MLLEPGLFIDRDNVVNICPPNKPGDPAGYITSWEQFEFMPDTMDAMFELYQMPYHIFVVSNQSGIDRENIDCSYSDIYNIFVRMEDAIADSIRSTILCNHAVPDFPELDLPTGYYDKGASRDTPVAIREFMFCQHLPDAGCACRKPKPGMIYALAVKWGIDLSKSWMIGDSASDMKAGWNAGIRKLIRIDESVRLGDDYVPTILAHHKKWNNASGLHLPSLHFAAKFIKTYDGIWEGRR